MKRDPNYIDVDDDDLEDMFEDKKIKNRKFREVKDARVKTRRRIDKDGETLNNLIKTDD